MKNIYTILEEIEFEKKCDYAAERIPKGGDIKQHIFSIVQKFYESIVFKEIESHSELKRLQEEIDEAEEKRITIICRNWGFGEQGNDYEEHQILMDIIESNQLKIKKIIESL